jgi:hypothetical protein
MATEKAIRRTQRNRERAREKMEREVWSVLGNRETTFEIDRQGSNRRRITVPAMFRPFLTERQRTVLKGKVRVCQAWTRMLNIMEDTGMSMAEFVEGLSVEELVKGQFKDKHGQFRGTPPMWVPREFHRACLSELMKRGRDMWQTNYLGAIEAMTNIALGRGEAGRLATPGERLKAAQFVVERMEGKVPDKLVVTQDRRWETVMDGIVAEATPEALARGRLALEGAQGVIIDADIVYDEDDYDDMDDEAPPKRKEPRRAHPQPRRRK